MAEEEDKKEFIQCLTAKEIKKLAKPEFAANPDKFYPTETLKRLGFSRASCPKCGNNYWRHTEKRQTCGDSQCEKRYNFIGVGTGIGRGKKGKKITYAEAWEGFSRSLSSARVPCTPIPRYPVVARWRADVDYVAAGIFCFQPYCVTGELEPPANPLICPQFCLRFNDLDNIGLTGRHYSGFVMLGIQVFNSPNNYKFWNHECVEFNYRWLTEELKIDPDEITFIEDVWAGGGNLGPSIEYFVGGLELGNMVFMQFKTFPDGRREPLQVQVIDVGIGLERIPWLINGSATSYADVFPRALHYLLSKINLDISTQIWEKYGPYSCLLNVDEVEDLDGTWKWISEQIGVGAEQVKAAIEPIKDVYVVLDHTRCVMMAIYDGSLPSNVGGASNIRNILRRVFSILQKRGWWEKLGMDGFLELFAQHQADLATLYGPFQPYKSFKDIIELEYKRWKTTDSVQQERLLKLLKKQNGALSIDDWIVAITSWGLPADTVSVIAKQEIPGKLYYELQDRKDRMMPKEAAVLYNTAHLPETVSLYYYNHNEYNFDATILEVIPNVSKKLEPSIVVLDRSHFYPTSGGQDHDIGELTIKGEVFQVVDAMKVGPCVLHVLDRPLSGELDAWKGVKVKGLVDRNRRRRLRNHHTATHIVFAACRRVLGPHVWQNGAKKSEQQAHLDITHYDALSHEQELAIQTEANLIVQRCKQITKGFMPKDRAEKKYGFHLYQGGVVPGNELRVVNISDTDTEACCGTHCDNTAEVGVIKLLKTGRVSDGIVRLYYVAGDLALDRINYENKILHKLTTDWGISLKDIEQTADRFFDGYKKLSNKTAKQEIRMLELQMRCLLLEKDLKLAVFRSDQKNPTLYISHLPAYAKDLRDSNKGVVFVAETFVYGLLGSPQLLDVKALEALLNELSGGGGSEGDGKKKSKLDARDSVTAKAKDSKDKKDKGEKVGGVLEFKSMGLPEGGSAEEKLVNFFIQRGFTEQE